MIEDYRVETVQSLCEILDDKEIEPKENVNRARRLPGAFTAQMSSEELTKIENSHEWIDILLANKSSPIDNKDNANLDKDTILSIIRKNAFGPDHNYANIEKLFSGVYPLSAMINHSCSPNAVRVFGRIPSPNSKTASYEIGHEMLRSRYGFTCQCTHCIKEETALNVAEYKELWALADGYWSLRDVNQNDEGASTTLSLVPSIEKVCSLTKQI